MRSRGDSLTYLERAPVARAVGANDAFRCRAHAQPALTQAAGWSKTGGNVSMIAIVVEALDDRFGAVSPRPIAGAKGR
jgi:hypothetical protein